MLKRTLSFKRLGHSTVHAVPAGTTVLWHRHPMLPGEFVLWYGKDKYHSCSAIELPDNILEAALL